MSSSDTLDKAFGSEDEEDALDVALAGDLLFHYADSSAVTTPLYVLPTRPTRSSTTTSQLVTILAQRITSADDLRDNTYHPLTTTQV